MWTSYYRASTKFSYPWAMQILMDGMYTVEGQNPTGTVRPWRHDYKPGNYVVTAENELPYNGKHISKSPTISPTNQKSRF